MIVVEAGRPYTLLVQVFIRYLKDQMPHRTEHPPPVRKRFLRASHVLQAMSREYYIIRCIRYSDEILGVTILAIPSPSIGADKIIPGSNIKYV